MSRKRLSKKQLKSDKFVERTFDWAHWIETHRTQALAGIGALVLVVGGIFLWRQMAGSAEEDASVEYAEARQAYFAGNWQLAASDLQGFLSRRGGSSYADDARLFLADAYYQAGQYQQAAETLERFVDEEDDSPFVGNARILLASSYEQLGQMPQAIAALERALEEADSDEGKIEVRTAMARIYEAQGNVDAAANQYRAIVETDPDGDAAVEARRRLAELTVEPITGPAEAAAPVEPEETASSEAEGGR
jgi:tetratricopeptide (TPR) repeat protein